MPVALRLSLIALGLAAFVCGTASLTGGWLGAPPWWERAAPMEPGEWMRRYRPAWIGIRALPGGWRPTPPGSNVPTETNDPPLTTADWAVTVPSELDDDDPWSTPEREAADHVEPRDGREWISGGVVAAGLAVTAFGAWRRRRRPDATT